jgi:enamine deaminase RidA (YjgF/YER057c/UK114 family)
MQKHAIQTHQESNPPTVAAPDGHFSQCVVVPAGTPMLFISGQVARAQDGSTVGQGNMTVQAETVFANLQAILTAHNATFANVLKVTLFITRMELAGEVVEVRQHFYGASKPASTFVGVTALNDPDWWLEVEMVAALPTLHDNAA